jgi:DNA primase
MADNQKNITVIDAVSEIKSRLDVVDVVSEHIALKKSGRNYWGCCPFHKEKTPSFSVNPDKGIFKCFGCGEGGDAISFLQKVNNKSFYEVVVDLSQKFGIQLQTGSFSPEKAELKTQILEINKETVKFYNELLLNSPDALKARNYLFKRNITEEVIEKFQIGFSLNSYDSLINHFNGKIKPDLLNQAGLVSERTNGNGYVDRFRGRIMVPIQDESGNYIAFGARALEDNQTPKYLNSPDTPVFNKSRSLFALYQAKQAIKEQDSVIIMEGFFDVISAHTHGLTNVVATLGTSLTEQHIKILAKYSDSRRIYLAFDSDEAGINATDRGAEIIKSVFAGLGEIKQFDENFAELTTQNNRSVCEIRIVSNTTGKDPDEFIRTEGLDSYKRVISEAPLLIDYQINRIMKLIEKTATPQEKSKVVKDLIPILADIKNSIIRDEYIKLVSEKLMVDTESISSEIRRNLQKVTERDKTRKTVINSNIEDKYLSAQKNLLSLYFLNSEKLSPLCINEYIREVSFSDKNISLIKQEIQNSIDKIQNPDKLSDELFAKLAENEDAKKILVDVICSLEDKKGMDTKALEQYIKDHIVFLKRAELSKQQDQLKNKYYASNKDDTSALEQQQLVKELIAQGRNTDFH